MVKDEIWIGLAEVVAQPGCKRLGAGKGAFVKVALWARSDADFRAKVEKAVSELNFHLVELEDREPIVRRLSRVDAGKETLQMAETAENNKGDAVFGAFHVWHKSDA